MIFALSMKTASGRSLKQLVLILLIAALIPLCGCILKGFHRPDKDSTDLERKMFDTALTLYERGEYKSARDLCSLHILSYPLSEYKEEVQYLLAKTLLKEGLYKKAEYEFKMYLRNFPATRRRDEILEKLRICQNKSAGGRLTKEVITPDSPEVRIERVPVEKQPESTQVKDSRKEPLKCAQILLLTCENIYEIRKEMEKLKRNNVNTIILRVFQNRGDRIYPFVKSKKETGVYFDTAEAPVVADILGPILDICKELGIKVFAWMTTRYCDWFIEENWEYIEKEYDLESRRIVTSKGLNIFHPDVVEYLTRLYMDLALYDIDGILFQDDLVLRHTQGFNEFAIGEFVDLYGIEPVPKKMFKGIYKKDGKYYVKKYNFPFDIWAKFKNRKILELADSIMRSVHAVNPDIKFALNLYYETVSDPKNALRWLSQDITTAKEYGFDYYSMMSYHDQIAKELGLSRHEAIYFVGKIASRLASLLENPSMALLKIQTIDWDSGYILPAWEIDEVFDSVIQTKGISLAFVPYRQGIPLEVIKKHFGK